MHPPDPPIRPPRIAAIGLASWDRLLIVERYPERGEYEIVTSVCEGPGGTTTNSAIALARLGAEVYIRAMVGDDVPGEGLRAALSAAGIDLSGVSVANGIPTDAATIVVSTAPPDRTIYWHQGARLVRGDRIDIPLLFGHDVVILDIDDAPLRRFLLDLPAHTLPATRLLGTLTYLAGAGLPDTFELLLRHDAIVGNARELIAITGAINLEQAIAVVQRAMPGQNLRTAAVSQGSAGSVAFTATEQWRAPAFDVPVVDTTGAGDAFTAAIAYGMACRWPWPVALRFANAVAGHSTTALGAQSALPHWDEVRALLEHGSTL